MPPGAQIDVSGLETRGSRILDRFYDEAFVGLPEATCAAAARWVESDLITEGGTRRPYPLVGLDDALRAAMRQLVDKRLLRIENTEQGDQVELVHDRLAAVAQQRARASQQQADAAVQAQRDLAEAEARLLQFRASSESRRAEEAVATARRLKRLTLGVIGGSVLALVGLVVSVQYYGKAKDEAVRARDALRESKSLIDGMNLRTQGAVQLAQTAQEALAAAEKSRQAAELLKGNDKGSRAKAEALLSEANSSLMKSAARETTPLKAACPGGARVYPQVGDAKDLDAVELLAKPLRAAGFIVPKTEVVAPSKVPSRLELRYFRAAESDVAVAAAAVLSGATVKYVRGFEDSTGIRPCHLEVWLPLSAPR